MDQNRNKYLAWIRASIIKHFRDKVALSAGGPKPQVKIYEIDDPTVDDIFLDCQPIFHDLTEIEKRIEIEMNMIIRTLQDDQAAYKSDMYKGYLLEAITSQIPIYKYGTEGDGSYFGCLQRRGTAVAFREFGEIVEQRLTVATCQAQYFVEFTT